MWGRLASGGGRHDQHRHCESLSGQGLVSYPVMRNMYLRVLIILITPFIVLCLRMSWLRGAFPCCWE